MYLIYLLVLFDDFLYMFEGVVCLSVFVILVGVGDDVLSVVVFVVVWVEEM